jgi:hypothetical protein
VRLDRLAAPYGKSHLFFLLFTFYHSRLRADSVKSFMKTITLAEIRKEMKEQKGTINQAILHLCSFIETCPKVKSVVHCKAFAQSCASDIYKDMGVGEKYTIKRKQEDGSIKEIELVRKPSADLCLRWFTKYQEDIVVRHKGWVNAKKEQKESK